MVSYGGVCRGLDGCYMVSKGFIRTVDSTGLQGILVIYGASCLRSLKFRIHRVWGRSLGFVQDAMRCFSIAREGSPHERIGVNGYVLV